MNPRLLVLLLCLLLFGKTVHAQSVPPGAIDREYLIVSGGVTLLKWERFKNPPHDIWWLNFIRASRIRIQQLRDQGVQGRQITWFVYLPAYKTRAAQEGKELISTITSVRDAYGVNLKFFSTTKELINYMNAGRPRHNVKIANFEYFGHSNKACFMFDYSNTIDSASKVWLHEDELSKINRGIFTRDAFVKSWGCHTGSSMSRKWRAATGVKMWGLTGRTQYLTHELPVPAKSDGRWVH